MATENYIDKIADKPEMTTCTGTASNVPDKYWKDRSEGYKNGYKLALKRMNDRLMNWLMLGVFSGFVAGYFLRQGFWLFVSIIGLIYLVEKVNKITLKNG